MRRLARHTFTAAAGLSLVLLLGLAALRWPRPGAPISLGEFSICCGNYYVVVELISRSEPRTRNRQWQPLGMSMGVLSVNDPIGYSGWVRLQYVQVPHRLAFPAMSVLPMAWAATRIVRHRKEAARGFDVQPSGEGEER